jgi:hypothetical protein
MRLMLASRWFVRWRAFRGSPVDVEWAPCGLRRERPGVLQAKGVDVTDEEVYKFVFPRSEAVLPRDDETMSPNLSFNSWVGFASGAHEAIVAGEFLLLEDEVNPVLSSLLGNRIQVTGLAQSSTFDGPRWFTLNFNGAGDFRQLASDVRRGMDAINEARRTGTLASRRKPSVALPQHNTIDGAPLDAILSMRGTVSGGVYRAAIGRKVLLRGETVGRELGMSTWVSFAGTNDRALGQSELVATAGNSKELFQRFAAQECMSHRFEITRSANTLNSCMFDSGEKVELLI